MKFGALLEKESVPAWRFYNIDYNSLKHYIKVHTTKGQGNAIAIPGQTDTALSKVEDELFLELCRQHDRVGLFVASKADEISRRLQHLQTKITRFSKKQKQIASRAANGNTDGDNGDDGYDDDNHGSTTSRKRQRAYAKLEHDVYNCGDDIQDLERFVKAQQVAFRKILKKYTKWTGSTSLGTRFKDDVLSHPKSFTKRGAPQALHTKFGDLVKSLEAVGRTLRQTAQQQTGDNMPLSVEDATSSETEFGHDSQQEMSQQSGQTLVNAPERYWNEYDDGSEAGDAEGEGYAIYITHDESSNTSPLTAIFGAMTSPISRARAWVRGSSATEQTSLLPETTLLNGNGDGDGHTYGTNQAARSNHSTRPPPGLSNQSSSTAIGESDDNDDDDTSSPRGDTATDTAFSSDDEFPAGYDAFYAQQSYHITSSSSSSYPHSYAHTHYLPSLAEQRKQHRHREQLLFYGTLACFTTSFVVLAISAVLIAAGKRKLKVQVDAGVAMGVVLGLGCACLGLGMAQVRRDVGDVWARCAVWVAFAGSCVGSGVLLVLVMGNIG